MEDGVQEREWKRVVTYVADLFSRMVILSRCVKIWKSGAIAVIRIILRQKTIILIRTMKNGRFCLDRESI